MWFGKQRRFDEEIEDLLHELCFTIETGRDKTWRAIDAGSGNEWNLRRGSLHRFHGVQRDAASWGDVNRSPDRMAKCFMAHLQSNAVRTVLFYKLRNASHNSWSAQPACRRLRSPEMAFEKTCMFHGARHFYSHVMRRLEADCLDSMA